MKSNLNTILLACTLGLLGFIGKTTFEMSREVSAMSASVHGVERRAESADRDLTELRARITQCEIELAKIKRTN